MLQRLCDNPFKRNCYQLCKREISQRRVACAVLLDDVLQVREILKKSWNKIKKSVINKNGNN